MVIKVILHKSISVLMALVVLFSTFSFTVKKHYCGNHLVDSAIFSKVKKCRMETAITAKTVVKIKSFCKDEVEIIKGQDQLKLSTFNNLDFNEQFVFTAFVYSYFKFYKSLPKQIIPFKYSAPPNLVADIQVLHDVFII